ncbi:MAG: SAM-dependent methyltransferase [Chitinophagaceae bacterium]
MFRNRLQKQLKHIGKQAKRLAVSCYRVYDHDLPEFPFCIELYGEKLYVAEYKRNHRLTDEQYSLWLQQSLQVMEEVFSLQRSVIFLKQRQRKETRGDQYKKLADAHAEFIVEENGLNFIVNLSDYLDTGLFLDHRLTRQMVKEEAAGKDVLNLFAYTGSFSVYAAAGGANTVTTIDLSKTYIEWAKRNMYLNGFADEEKYQFLQADVLQWLPQQSLANFDLIILDPPSFSNSQRMEDFLDIQKDHPRLINDCLRLLRRGGMIYFSTNLKKFTIYSDAIQSKNIIDITRATEPFDFRGKLNRYCFKIFK